MITCKDLWLGLIQSVIHTENISWARLYNFLMGNSILVLAWATLYVAKDVPCITKLVMTAICVLGGASGIAWYGLGKRTRQYVDLHVAQGERVEGYENVWESGIKDEDKPFLAAKKIRDENKETRPNEFYFSSNPFLLTAGPICFTVLYALMFLASWWPR